MKLNSDKHFSYLTKSYNQVGSLTWENNDFIQSSLDSSRNLFTKKSIALGEPKPKKFEVYALLSGLTFSKELVEKLVDVQNRIFNLINPVLHYSVLPSNFGVEYCVFKWPNQIWKDSWLTLINNELSSLKNCPFVFTIKGIQVNSDGCIIAKGYDDESMIFKIRKKLKSSLKFLPKKQSGWCHIPIGRILEPIGSEKFKQLENFINKISDTIIHEEKISSVKFVHETRWYMEEKSILSEFHFNSKIINEY
jgi:hypothetical protein